MHIMYLLSIGSYMYEMNFIFPCSAVNKFPFSFHSHSVTLIKKGFIKCVRTVQCVPKSIYNINIVM